VGGKLANGPAAGKSAAGSPNERENGREVPRKCRILLDFDPDGGLPMIVTFAFLHHLAAFTLVAALAIEFMLIREEITAANAKRLVIVDTVFGASAGVLLVVGLLRVFFFEKGYAYYFTSHAFLTKLALFIVVGVASAIPTIEFMRWRKVLKAGQAPSVDPEKIRTIRKIMHWELAGIVLILLFAAMMAKGGFI
jgi:putative membrane protein